MISHAHLDERSLALRRIALKALIDVGGGHVGASFSSMEIMRVLYDSVAAHRPSEPLWAGRDRIILSKGHGCLSQYVLLADHRYFDVGEISRVGKRFAMLGGHPESGQVPGVEFSTGSLGHGLSVGVGMAIELRRRRSASRVFVVLGDGELGEGSVWEALLSARHHGLTNLAVIVDRNGLQSAGRTSDILDTGPLVEMLAAFGCLVREVDGHDPVALEAALTAPDKGKGPLAVVCATTKGRGLAVAENTPTWHYRMGFTEEEIASMWESLSARSGLEPEPSEAVR
ncbi:transketolase [Cryobacterium sp. SO2]|uniref:transketolase n=1 Tax=Cryobacterium sp. SO2 TaxID=1897060 RepID=UPI00223DE7F4|nr:transketolase [Cryobacterium sp. SO2]WEO77304.1 transketolase [Cryobacterium sp. SO2]